MQVIGELKGADGWHEVMDMASGRVYFWESATNGVAWDPPAGSHPRSTSLQQQHELQAERDTATASQAAQISSAQSDPSTSSSAVSNLDADIKRLGRGLVTELAEALLARMGPHAVPDLLRLAIQAEISMQDYQAVACLFKEQQQQEPLEVKSICFSLQWPYTLSQMADLLCASWLWCTGSTGSLIPAGFARPLVLSCTCVLSKGRLLAVIKVFHLNADRQSC